MINNIQFYGNNGVLYINEFTSLKDAFCNRIVGWNNRSILLYRNENTRERNRISQLIDTAYTEIFVYLKIIIIQNNLKQ